MSEPTPTPDRPEQLSPNLVFGAAVLLTLVAAGLYVYLRNEDSSASGGMLFLLPVITALYVKAGIDVSALATRRRLDRQDQALAVITHQTNGVLDAKIRDGVEAALDKRDAHLGQTVAALQAAAQPGIVPAAAASQEGRPAG